MLTLISARFATVEELFCYKKSKFRLKQFPGYTNDQWGIKAHNRPWVDSVGQFDKDQNIIEVGGAYSTLPEYLANKYKLNSWIGDDFGKKAGEKIWMRWGSPQALKEKNIKTNYIFEPFGIFSKKYKDNFFDRIFSISTLEHIDSKLIIDVFKDMNRCTKKGGMQLHAIDLRSTNLFGSVVGLFPFMNSELKMWEKILRKSGINMATKMPSILGLLDRSILVESPDVVFRFYPPNNDLKEYNPNASLLLVIKDL